MIEINKEILKKMPPLREKVSKTKSSPASSDVKEKRKRNGWRTILELLKNKFYSTNIFEIEFLKFKKECTVVL